MKYHYRNTEMFWNSPEDESIIRRMDGLPPKKRRSKTIRFRLNEKQFTFLQLYCQEMGLNLSHFIREAVCISMNKHNVNPWENIPDEPEQMLKYIQNSLKKRF
jgi:hypothetical protein